MPDRPVTTADGRVLETIVPYGHQSSARCGYCKNDKDKRPRGHSMYVKITSISSEFYQDLLDRSWRRSGSLMYRPHQRKQCCPHYTIRLDSGEFKPSKSQRQVVNRFNKYILGDKFIKETARLHPLSRAEAKRRDTEFELTERIHEAEHKNLKTPPEPGHKLEVTLEQDTFTKEKWEVWDNYQRNVHREDAEDRDEESFRRFLCESKVRRGTMKNSDGSERLLGSYHQCYRIDGKLVAIGVLDLLPQCVSSVYFLYHESFAQFVPGKLSALREISLAIEGGYRYWYPGYYIHSCPKMRYKMDYRPQSLLDPESLSWDRVDDEILKMLDNKTYVSVSRERRLTRVPGSDANEDDSKDTRAFDADDQRIDDDEAVLWDIGMPGIGTKSAARALDIGSLWVAFSSRAPAAPASMLGWGQGELSMEPRAPETVIAELIACVGLDSPFLESLCLDFRNSFR